MIKYYQNLWCFKYQWSSSQTKLSYMVLSTKKIFAESLEYVCNISLQLFSPYIKKIWYLFRLMKMCIPHGKNHHKRIIISKGDKPLTNNGGLGILIRILSVLDWTNYMTHFVHFFGVEILKLFLRTKIITFNTFRNIMDNLPWKEHLFHFRHLWRKKKGKKSWKLFFCLHFLFTCWNKKNQKHPNRVYVNIYSHL